MNCPKCGNELAPNMKFCAKCGTAVQQPAAMAIPTQPKQEFAQPGMVTPKPSGKEFAQPAKDKQKKKKGAGFKAIIAVVVVLVLAVLSVGGVFLADSIIYNKEKEENGFITDFPILKQKTDLLVYDAEKFPYEEYNITVERASSGKLFKSSTFNSYEKIIDEKSANPIYSIDFKEDGNYKITLEGIVASRIQAETESTTKKEEPKTVVIIVIVDNDNEKAVDKVTINSKKDDKPIEDLSGLLSSQGGSEKLTIQESATISAGRNHTVGLKKDGTVVAVGNNSYGQCDVSNWKDIVAVSAGGDHTVGLKKDGTVVAVGDNRYGECDVSNWKDIVAVSAGSLHTVGLKKDGTVVAVGANGSGECDVSNWKDIVAVSVGWEHTVGLKKDGTVVAVGYNSFGKCDVSNWKDIVAVSADLDHTVGLKKDGTVVAVGSNEYGQCDVSNWKDMVAVSVGDYHTVGLKKDGTVVAVGYNYSGQCDVSNWKDIVAVSADLDHTVGLKKDGTVVAVGCNDLGQCNVSDWKDIRVPGKTDSQSASDTQVPSGEKTDKPADTKEENGVAEWEYSDNFLPAEITAEYDQNTKMVDKVIFEISIPKSYEGHGEMLATYEELSDYMSSDKSFSVDFLDETDYTTVVISFDDLSGDSRSDRVALLSEFIGAQYPPEDYYVSYDYLNDALTAEGFTKK